MTFILWPRVFLSRYPSHIQYIFGTEVIKCFFAPPLAFAPQIPIQACFNFLYTSILNTYEYKSNLRWGGMGKIAVKYFNKTLMKRFHEE